MIGFALGVLCLGFVLTVIALAMVWNKVVDVEIELKAMQKSTHQLTWIDPLTHNFNKPTKQDEKEVQDQADNPLDSII